MLDGPFAEAESPPPRGQLACAITNVIVRLHARLDGRGPTRANTHVQDGSYVLCMLRDPFTVAERTLIEAGRASAVNAKRGAFYAGAGPRLRAEVERLTGHAVVAFIPGVSIEHDLVTQLFVLDGSYG